MLINSVMSHTPKEIINLYFDRLNKRMNWQELISADIDFSTPSKSTKGKEFYVTATTRFLQLVQSLNIAQLIIEENNVCALVNYQLQSPSGNKSNCKVAEILSVNNDKISSSSILFDTAAFQAFIERG